MPAPKLDSMIVEYEFTPEELRAARILDQLKILYYQTLYAKTMKEKAALLIPRKMEMDDRDFIASVAELDGRLNTLQELLTGSLEAQKESVLVTTPQSNSSVEDIERRASRYVNRPPQA